MIKRNDIIEVINILSDDIISMILEFVKEDEVPEDFYIECDTIKTYLDNFQIMMLVTRLATKYRLNIDNLLVSECHLMPIRYLACYLLLNGGVVTYDDKRKTKK